MKTVRTKLRVITPSEWINQINTKLMIRQCIQIFAD